MEEFIKPELIPLVQKERVFSGNTREVYCQILGCKKMPKSPDEMPGKIFLPPEVLGSAEEAILMTLRHGEEQSQFVDWNKERRCFIPLHLFWGSEEEISLYAYEEIDRRIKLGKKALLFYHTHPGWRYARFAFETDVALIKALPKLAFIFAVYGENEAAFLCQTKKSERLSLKERLLLFSKLKSHQKLIKAEAVEIKDSEVAIYEREGFVLYHWRPYHLTKIREGDLRNGLIASRVTRWDTFWRKRR